MEIERVADGLQFPEGPVAMADGSVLVTEVKGGRIVRVSPSGEKSVVAELGGGANGAAIGPDGALYVVNNGGSAVWHDVDGLIIPGQTRPGYQGGYVQRVDLATGEARVLYDSCAGEPFRALNDLVFDSTGGFWFTDSGVTIPGGRMFGALYYARADGSHVEKVRKYLLSPNGVGLSPDERVVYMADTQLQRIWAFDVAEAGRLAPPPEFQPGRVVCNLPDFQVLDSLAVEEGGAVCVATIFNSGITVIHPDGEREHYPFPDRIVTNICFGGEDMCTAWVTCGSAGTLYRCRWPRPGLRLAFNG